MTILSPRMAAACAGLRSVTASPPSVVAAAGLVFFAVTILGTAMASGRFALPLPTPAPSANRWRHTSMSSLALRLPDGTVVNG